MSDTPRPIAATPAQGPALPGAPPTGMRWLPRPLTSVVLLGMWLLLAQSLAPGDIVIGAILGIAIPIATRGFQQDTPRIASWGAVARFVPVFLWDLLVANFTVAWRIAAFWRPVRPAWIVIPLDVREPHAITMLASVISLTPGTVSSELSEERGALRVHVLDTDDPDAEVARIKQRYERPILEMFGC